jgi:hypothetical protein
MLVKFWLRYSFLTVSDFYSISMGIESIGSGGYYEDCDLTSIIGICFLRPRFFFNLTLSPSGIFSYSTNGFSS